ncbi:hypothetical protein ABZU25_32570 [Micromonospora sp. NPDC005215]|uniref:hypothetical protein n=1 Tax=Micromonospora sp. NPDC005215 TaxID=3157024 RepID=UPI0033B5A235
MHQQYRPQVGRSGREVDVDGGKRRPDCVNRPEKITHSKGESNFVVESYNLESGEGGLLINEIGGYSGTRPLDAPALVQVTADGNWSINPA